MAPPISVVVISRNEGIRLRQTVGNLQDTLPPDSEILVVDDASTDGSAAFLATRRPGIRLRRASGLGVAGARNWGAARTTGEILVFADAHIGLPADWWRPLCAAIADPRVAAASPAISNMDDPARVGYGLTLSSPDLNATWLKRSADIMLAPVLPGCCVAMRREVFDAFGGFDARLAARGGVDNELCLRLWLLGYELCIVSNVTVSHYFRANAPYPVTWGDVLYNRLRLALLHLGEKRIGTVSRTLSGYDEFGPAMVRLVNSDVRNRRSLLARKKIYTDDWFFEKFGLNW